MDPVYDCAFFNNFAILGCCTSPARLRKNRQKTIRKELVSICGEMLKCLFNGRKLGEFVRGVMGYCLNHHLKP